MWAYGIGASEGIDVASHWETLQWLAEHGFRTNPYVERFDSIEEVAKRCAEWEHKRIELDYEIDGIVVKVDSLDQQRRLGALHDRPRWARAYKWAPMTAQTKLVQIHIRVGRTGALNPWAQLEPVEVGGVTVSTATLHNEEDINRKDIREGDRVIVQRAGDVIPQVVDVVLEKRPKDAKPYRFPKKCPCYLHTDIVREETATGEEGARARCSGEFACPYQKIEHLKLFASRRAFDIEGLGEKQIELFFEKEWVKEPADIFALPARNKKIKLEEIEGYGQTSVRNLFAAIE